jgi:hypothetical protein
MIKPLFNTSDIRKALDDKIQRVEAAILAILRRRGEQFVQLCRDENTYKDKTGNLRSSLGYFIYKGNVLIEDNLQGNNEGREGAKEAVTSITKMPDVYYLIGVAGMNYAAAVESKGFNVISNQSLMIISLLEGDLQKLKNKLL